MLDSMSALGLYRARYNAAWRRLSERIGDAIYYSTLGRPSPQSVEASVSSGAPSEPFVAVRRWHEDGGRRHCAAVMSMSERVEGCTLFSPYAFAAYFPYSVAGQMLREAFDAGRISSDEYERGCRCVMVYHHAALRHEVRALYGRGIVDVHEEWLQRVERERAERVSFEEYPAWERGLDARLSSYRAL